MGICTAKITSSPIIKDNRFTLFFLALGLEIGRHYGLGGADESFGCGISFF
jgi:hypothetical protein